MHLLVTGGCGFIGSNFVRLVQQERPDWRVTVFDALTYAGNLANLSDLKGEPSLRFTRGDIAVSDSVRAVMTGAEAVLNFAAESHVDRSILDSAPFIRTNVVGTHCLLDAALELGVRRFLQISTDEVYGSLGPQGQFTELTPLAPNSPYSSSKAAGDLLVRAYIHTHKLPALVVRSSNAYGPYQFPEKLIPLMIANAMSRQRLPVYGDGLHVRDWVHVLDLCRAILLVLEKGSDGEIYNVGGGNELTNLYVVRQILELTGADPALIKFVPDRPGHDRRYAMNHTKLTAELGWLPQRDFAHGLRETVDWYRANQAWVQSVRSGEYLSYYERQYAARLAAGTAAGPA
ncbi:MAG TPA: dTDP-glucose 4,6-dehydratase [Gemmatimonadales bacterium]|nr:dTDP-glucose 4,6-dehydratase [Gemmatimonadales bacterium]